jgi:allantoicase
MTGGTAEVRALEADEAAPWTRRLLNVADSRLGAQAVSASDEFFAAKERMLQPGEPEWRAGVYDDCGKWMDGWESRRRRDGGFDHCVVRLAGPSTLQLLEIDTRYFTGNYPPFASVEAAHVSGAADAGTVWSTLLPRVPLRGDHRQFYLVDAGKVWTHLRLNIYPDGGVARFRAYGTLFKDWSVRGSDRTIDLAAALNGGRALCCSDEHYGSMHNLLLPGRGSSMADGWETRRRRTPGFDWVLLQLGSSGHIEAVEIDTAHFKGNFPHQLSINGALLTDARDTDLSTADLSSQCLYWPTLLEPQLLQADHLQRFELDARKGTHVSHLRVNIHPDGGLSRIRVLGRPTHG